MRNVHTLLDAGFTSAYSGAAAKMRLDVVIRNEIEVGLIPGPGMRAARFGGELMGRGDELGLLQPGFLADLLIVSGDPVADIRILQDQSKIVAVIKGGVFHREPEPGARAYKGRRAA